MYKTADSNPASVKKDVRNGLHTVLSQPDIYIGLLTLVWLKKSSIFINNRNLQWDYTDLEQKQKAVTPENWCDRFLYFHYMAEEV